MLNKSINWKIKMKGFINKIVKEKTVKITIEDKYIEVPISKIPKLKEYAENLKEC